MDGLLKGMAGNAFSVKTEIRIKCNEAPVRSIEICSCRLPEHRLALVCNELSAGMGDEDLMPECRQSLEHLLVESFAGICEIDLATGSLEYINPLGLGLLGIVPEARQTLGWRDLLMQVCPECRRGLLRRYRQLRTGGPAIEVGCRIRSFAGEDMWLKLKMSNMRNGDGNLGKLLLVALDSSREKQLEERLIHVTDEVLKEFGRDLHDSILQLLGGLQFMSASLEKDLDGDETKHSKIKRISYFLAKAREESNRVLRGISPVSLDHGDLAVALSNLALDVESLFGIRCTVVVEAEDLPRNDDTLANIYAIAREAAYNAARHSDAGLIDIAFRCDSDGGFVLNIFDDGDGYCGESACGRNCMGVNNMRMRAEHIGAEFEIKAIKGVGTLVSCMLRSQDTLPGKRNAAGKGGQ
jgi:signal transduction histidine kinase